MSKQEGDLRGAGGDAAQRRLKVAAVGLERLPCCHEIRHEVFVLGQGVPRALELDGLDAQAQHFLAELGGRPVGTARARRLADSGKVERVAVLGEVRGLGIGRALMEAVHSWARRVGIARLNLHAQRSAVPFYTALGYASVGEPFEEAGIEHQAMCLVVRPGSGGSPGG